MATYPQQNSTPPVVADRMDIGQKVMIVVVLLVVLVGGYFVFQPSAPAQEKAPESELAALPVVQPVVTGNVQYSLGGVHWVFEPQTVDESGAPTTRVRLQLDNFKRNNSPIEVGLYRLGTYRGACADHAAPELAALAVAQCDWSGVARQLAVFQEGSDLVVKVRSVAADGARTDALTPILTIDLTSIVQPAS